MHRLTSLISVPDLVARQSDENLVILDASWYLPTDGRNPGAEYLARHIPGAHFLTLKPFQTRPTRARICCRLGRCLPSRREHWVLAPIPK